MDEILQQALEITRAQAGVRVMTEDQIAEYLMNVAKSIANIATGTSTETLEENFVPVEDPKRSIREKTVTCLVCGKKFKVITRRHLAQHNLTPADYREKFGLKKDVPLVCKELLRTRKDKMQEMRLWEKRRSNEDKNDS